MAGQRFEERLSLNIWCIDPAERFFLQPGTLIKWMPRKDDVLVGNVTLDVDSLLRHETESCGWFHILSPSTNAPRGLLKVTMTRRLRFVDAFESRILFRSCACRQSLATEWVVVADNGETTMRPVTSSVVTAERELVSRRMGRIRSSRGRRTGLVANA